MGEISTEILEGIYEHLYFQETLAGERDEDTSLLQKLNSWMSGERKSKKMWCQLFRVQIVMPHLINTSVPHIRDNTHTAKSIPRVMDM
jgi:hypothetical protein